MKQYADWADHILRTEFPRLNSSQRQQAIDIMLWLDDEIEYNDFKERLVALVTKVFCWK